MLLVVLLLLLALALSLSLSRLWLLLLLLLLLLMLLLLLFLWLLLLLLWILWLPLLTEGMSINVSLPEMHTCVSEPEALRPSTQHRTLGLHSQLTRKHLRNAPSA